MDNIIKVLIVDDSALARQLFSQYLSSDPEIKVVGVAADPIIALKKIEALEPDIITLDVEMPRMDGITFLEKLMTERPMPVLMVSSLTSRGCETALRALEIGAVDFVTKPKVDIVENLPAVMDEIVVKIKACAGAKLMKSSGRRTLSADDPDSRIVKKMSSAMAETTDKVIAIGASTGGTQALSFLLTSLPADSPGICVVQHMPERFTRVFSERLDSICKVNVNEARDGDTVLKGHVLIAPGNFHMLLNRSGARYYVSINSEPRVNRHRPSVDLLFTSTARHAGPNSAGIIMTGMGADGARGLLEMKECGACTIAQDEHSCIVFGMPKEAIKLGAVDRVMPLKDIPSFISQLRPDAASIRNHICDFG